MDETTGARNIPGSPSPTEDTTPALSDETAREQPTDQLPTAEPVAERPAAEQPAAERPTTTEPIAEQPAAAPPPGTGIQAEGTAAAGTGRPSIRLRRSRDERMIAGVCGGLAQVLGVDVVILRLALVLATVLGVGAGVILYLACWILMPVAPETESTHAVEQAPALNG